MDQVGQGGRILWGPVQHSAHPLLSQRVTLGETPSELQCSQDRKWSVWQQCTDSSLQEEILYSDAQKENFRGHMGFGLINLNLSVKNMVYIMQRQNHQGALSWIIKQTESIQSDWIQDSPWGRRWAQTASALILGSSRRHSALSGPEGRFRWYQPKFWNPPCDTWSNGRCQCCTSSWRCPASDAKKWNHCLHDTLYLHLFLIKN